MSETWKGGEYRGGAVHRWTDRCATNDCQPVIVCPIEDESLPHPGDGKDYEADLHPRWRWEPVVVRTPVIGADGHDHIVVSDQNGVPYMLRPWRIRERKPEHEHKPWCHKSRGRTWTGNNPPRLACSCERRSGEDRRSGDRRGEKVRRRGRRVTDRVAHGVSSRTHDRRSGKDRRSS